MRPFSFPSGGGRISAVRVLLGQFCVGRILMGAVPAFLALAPASFFGCADMTNLVQGTPELPRYYEDTLGRFRQPFPEDWFLAVERVEKAAGRRQKRCLFQPKRGEPLLEMELFVDIHEPAAAPPFTGLALAYAERLRAAKAFSITALDSARFHGIPAQVAEYRWNLDGEDYLALQEILARGPDRVYTLTFRCRARSYAANRRLFTAMAESFAFLPARRDTVTAPASPR